MSECKLLLAPRHLRLARERPDSEASLNQEAMRSEARTSEASLNQEAMRSEARTSEASMNQGAMGSKARASEAYIKIRRRWGAKRGQAKRI